MKAQEVAKKAGENVRVSEKALLEIEAKATKGKTPATPKAETVAKPAKVKKEPKVKAPVHEPFARIQAVGEIMRQFPKAPTEEIINRADLLFRERTGKKLNPEETKTQYSKAVNFLLGFQKPV